MAYKMVERLSQLKSWFFLPNWRRKLKYKKGLGRRKKYLLLFHQTIYSFNSTKKYNLMGLYFIYGAICKYEFILSFIRKIFPLTPSLVAISDFNSY